MIFWWCSPFLLGREKTTIDINQSDKCETVLIGKKKRYSRLIPLDIPKQYPLGSSCVNLGERSLAMVIIGQEKNWMGLKTWKMSYSCFSGETLVHHGHDEVNHLTVSDYADSGSSAKTLPSLGRTRKFP